MRRPRLCVDANEGEALYHCISRTAGGEFLLGIEEKEAMRRQMWTLAEYCGVELVTYALLSNHFHLLVRVPQRRFVSDQELLRRFEVLYPRLKPQQRHKLERVREAMTTDGALAQAWRAQQSRQMFSISAFLKLFKMRFSIWYNARTGRKGTLWSERFKSLLVEDGDALRKVAAYIDLNSVRAGLVTDPKDYRFCGYAEAVAGNRKAQRGLCSLYGKSWTQTGELYRCVLFARGSELVAGKCAIRVEELRHVTAEGGRLPLGILLRCRIRYFTDGAIIGSEDFVTRQISQLKMRCVVSNRSVPQVLDCRLGWDHLRVISRMRGGLLS